MIFGSRKKIKTSSRKIEVSSPRRVLLRQVGVGVLIVAFFSLLVTGIWYGSRVESLTLQTVSVVGGETIPVEMLEEIAYQELEGTYYHLVPKQFAWTYPRRTIESRILEIDRVRNVRAERTNGTELTLVFEEYQPFTLWCESLEDTTCLFLDHTGYAFAPAPKLEGAAFLRFSEIDRVPEKDTAAFLGDFLSETIDFRLEAYDRVALNIIHVEKTADEEVTYHIAGGGELKTTLRMSTEETIENLETILASQEFNHLEPGNFQYIDLRYGNKVFVNEEPEVIATTTATSTE